jgi:uncharacterized protein
MDVAHTLTAPPSGETAPAITETHISVLVALGDRVYKLKKPVSFGFLDFSAREARQRACHREVELNRRLAPDVYLGVADVVGEDGEVCDHLVVMRRMPASRRLSTLVRSGAPIDGELRDIARRLAVFHAAAPTGPEIATAARIDQVQAVWEANFAEVAPFVGRVLDRQTCDRVESLVRRYLSGRSSLFDHRIALGAARDGHGDVQAEDIFCLDDGPRILDCIEFDDRLRYGDVLADVAFLAMDLERLGAPAAATSFVHSYEELAGTTFPPSLLHHYIAARAHVRAKVACLRYGQGDTGAATVANELLDLARRHLEAARVRLVLVGGLPGTGKSTLAERLAGETGWMLLRSDEIRKDLAGVAHTPPAPVAPGEGLYGPELTAETYAELLDRAARALEQGESVVLDASWADARHRDAAASLARSTVSDLVELCCCAPADLAGQRIRARLARNDGPSDATPDVAAAMADRFDPWPASVAVDTAGALSSSVAVARRATGAKPPDALEMLLDDHRRLRDLLEQLDGEERPVEMSRVFLELVTELAAHEAAEDDVVFPALRAAFPALEPDAGARLDEHREVNELIAEMRDLAPSGFGFCKRASALVYELRAHFAAEEEAIFPHLRAAIDPAGLIALGERIEAAKRKAARPAQPAPV